MKKRIFSLVLCAVMLFSAMAFTGCSEEEMVKITIGSEAKAMTITLYSIVEEGTTDLAIQTIQDAINEITEFEYNTHIVLKFYTEDEYSDIIEERIVKIEETMELESRLDEARKTANKAIKAVGVTTAAKETEETTEETNETEFNKYGLVESVYPEENDDQLDIFLINNVEMYNDLAERGVLANLDEELSINSKILKDYIYPTLISGAKYGTTTYGIPNNHVIGEYTYLLINRELADKYYFHPSNLETMASVGTTGYLDDIIANEPDVTPMLNDFYVNVAYPCDPNPIIGSVVSIASDGTAQATPKILPATVQSYRNVMNFKHKYAAYTSYGELSDYDKVGAAVVTGTYADGLRYAEDYYVSVIQNPTVDNEEAFNGLYCVSTYTENVKRCMEIIELFTTDEEIVNLLTYGVENKNYTKVEDSDNMIDVLDDESNPYRYVINPRYTGNQYLQYLTTDMPESLLELAANDWEYGKQQNLSSVLNPYVGLVLDMSVPDPDEEVPATAATPTGTGDTTPEATGTPEAVVPKKEYMPLAELLEKFKDVCADFENDLAKYDGSQGEYIDYLEELGFKYQENEIVSQLMDFNNPRSLASQYKKLYDSKNAA